MDAIDEAIKLYKDIHERSVNAETARTIMLYLAIREMPHDFVQIMNEAFGEDGS